MHVLHETLLRAAVVLYMGRWVGGCVDGCGGARAAAVVLLLLYSYSW